MVDFVKLAIPGRGDAALPEACGDALAPIVKKALPALALGVLGATVESVAAVEVEALLALKGEVPMGVFGFLEKVMGCRWPAGAALRATVSALKDGTGGFANKLDMAGCGPVSLDENLFAIDVVPVGVRLGLPTFNSRIFC